VVTDSADGWRFAPTRNRGTFFALPTAESAPTHEPSKTKSPDQAEWERSYLDPNFLNSFSAEIRKRYREAMENILQETPFPQPATPSLSQKNFPFFPKRSNFSLHSSGSLWMTW